MVEKQYLELNGLILEACHGVYDFEKVLPQRFSIDLKIYFSFVDACSNDNLNSTISFDEIYKKVFFFVKENTFDLVEKLAYETCAMLMDNFIQIQEIEISIKKTKPPVKVTLSNIGANLSLKREEVFLAIGSSIGDKKGYLDFAVDRLKQKKGIQVLKVSDYIGTDPYGGIAQNQFMNGAIKISTYLEPHELLKVINQIEKEGDRKRDIHWGDRTLDIDIIFFGEHRINTPQLTIPHKDWENRDFVKIPLENIEPGISERFASKK